MTAPHWPAATLNPIRRAKVLASAIPSAAFTEGILDAPFDRTWAWVSELEHSVPRFDNQVDRIRIHSRIVEDGVTRVKMTASRLGIPLRFDVRVEDGFCLMKARARLYLVVMAAQPEDEGERTRFFHMEAVPLPGTGPFHRLIQREVNSDFANLRRIAGAGFKAGA